MFTSSLKKERHFSGIYDRSTGRLMVFPFLFAKSNVAASGGSRTSNVAGSDDVGHTSNTSIPF